MRRFLVPGVLLLAFVISSCAITVPQDAFGTSTAMPAQNVGQTDPQVTKVPVTWANLHLSGKLVYIGEEYRESGFTVTVQVLDLATGDISTIFRTDADSYLYGATVAPDGKQLLLSYASTDPQAVGVPALYVVPIDGSAPPKLLFAPAAEGDEYFQPVWSPDGKYIYYSRFGVQKPAPKDGPSTQDVEILRMSYPDGVTTTVADSAFWTNVSEDSTRIVYVSIDPVYGTNQLVLANADGSDAHVLEMTGDQTPNIIDAPIFSPDGKSILFSAVSRMRQSSKPTWLDQLFGVTVASAHMIPSDWWSVPVSGGTPTQLTHIQATNLFADISPDKQYLVSYSDYGMFVMKPDGSGLTTLLNNSMSGYPTTVSWLP